MESTATLREVGEVVVVVVNDAPPLPLMEKGAPVVVFRETMLACLLARLVLLE